jgi:hypothetical protein
VVASWSGADSGLQAIASGLIVADWIQSRHMARYPQAFYEDGVARAFIGKHPSPRKVDVYFSACLVGHWWIARTLDRPYRSWWQCVWISAEGFTVKRNWRVGVSLQF